MHSASFIVYTLTELSLRVLAMTGSSDFGGAVFTRSESLRAWYVYSFSILLTPESCLNSPLVCADNTRAIEMAENKAEKARERNKEAEDENEAMRRKKMIPISQQRERTSRFEPTLSPALHSSRCSPSVACVWLACALAEWLRPILKSLDDKTRYLERVLHFKYTDGNKSVLLFSVTAYHV